MVPCGCLIDGHINGFPKQSTTVSILYFKVAFSHLYSTGSPVDKCTLYSDRNLINRRNVGADVESHVNTCRRFFSLEVKAPIIAACTKELGIEEYDDTPEVLKVSGDKSCWTDHQKREFVRKLSLTVCDTHVLDQKKHKKFITAWQKADHRERNQRSDMTANGRYKCRYPGCKSIFASNRQCHRSHEAKHDPPVNVPEDNPSVDMVFEDETERADDMYNYQKSLMEIGMLIMNIQDAIQEGDGGRSSEMLENLTSLFET